MFVDYAASYVPILAQVLCEATSLMMCDAINLGSTVGDRIFAPNIRVLLDMVKESAPYMGKEESDVVVGSIAAYTQLPKLGIYSVTRTAVQALVKALAKELAKRGHAHR